MENPRKPAADIYQGIGSGDYAVRAPRGVEISCLGWPQEAVLRMLMNGVDRDVAEAPESLVPCHALGKVASDWSAFRAIAGSLRALPGDATLLIRDGQSAGRFSTSADCARALILNSDPAASWLNIGPQLFVPESYEILDAAKRQYFRGDLRGKLIAADEMSFAGAALSLASTLQGAAFLGIDADSERIKRYVKAGYCDVMVNSLDEALRILKNAARKHEPASVGLTGLPSELTREMASRGVVPDFLADATNPGAELAGELQSGVGALQQLGSILLGSMAHSTTTSDAATVCCVALSGEPSDMQGIDRLLIELFPEDASFVGRLHTVERRVRYQGLPARALWLSGPHRRRLATEVNQLVTRCALKGPIVFGRLAPSFRTLRKHDEANAPSPKGSELEALLPLAAGATWASVVRDSAGRARVTATAVVADGTSEASTRIKRLLTQNALW